MRRSLVAVIVVILMICIAWWQRRPSPALPPSGELHAVTPPAPEWPAIATRRPMPPPAIALERPVVLRPAPAARPGALEGTVVDADTGDGIARAELTFSHDEGAYSTVTGGDGAFRFAPPA